MASTFYTAGNATSTPKMGHRRVPSAASSAVLMSEEGSPASSSMGDPNSSDAVSKTEAKIAALKDRLGRMTREHEADVEEYIGMSGRSPDDNPQFARVTQRFEKKNKKYTIESELVQRKIEQLTTEGGEGGGTMGGTTNMLLANVSSGLKGMGANIKETITDYTGSVLSAPTALASRIKNKFGSADDLRGEGDTHEKQSSMLPARTSATLPLQIRLMSTEGEEETDVATLRDELSKLRHRQESIEATLSQLQTQMRTESSFVHSSLLEERFRGERMEERLNDTIELQQEEVKASKQEMQRVANRIEYSHMDTVRELKECIEQCVNRLQLVEQSMERGEEGRAGGWHDVTLHLANIMVETLKLGMFIAAIACDVVKPLVGSRNKAALLILLLIALSVVFHIVFTRFKY